MSDILLEKMFDPERWKKAIDIGVAKGIDLGSLRRVSTPEVRVMLYRVIKAEEYEIAPPRMQLIPKDEPGKFRTVYINTDLDRLVLSIVNDLCFEEFPEMVSKYCMSYQKGIGTGKIVQKISRQIENANGKQIGYVSDLTKYFDSVPIQYIDKVFDNIEAKVGHSAVVTFLRKYYHSDLCYDLERNLVEKYQSLKQGCAFASFLADAMLFEIDERLGKTEGITYVRYSDDTLIVGKEYESAFNELKCYLEGMGMSLNPKKVKPVSSKEWFKFLGFNIKGKQITLSKSRVKKFQKEIEKRMKKSKSYKGCLNSINRYMYIGDGQYSWATGILPIINVDKDIDTMNQYVMDALRASYTGKKKIGGLGVINGNDYTIVRGTGKNVKANKGKTSKDLDGYYSMQCMQNALKINRNVYDTLVRSM